MSKPKKGDRVQVTTHEYDTTPDGNLNTGYAYGLPGVVDSVRNTSLAGRILIVLLDGKEPDDPMGAYVDWRASDVKVVT